MRELSKWGLFSVESMNRSNVALQVISLLGILFYGGTGGTEPSMASPGLPHDVYVEGTYRGNQEITFSLSVAQENFVKIFSNGVVILGERENGEAVYHFIDNDKKLITKVSQRNLYRIGEFRDWDSMVRLIHLRPGTRLVQEKPSDDKKACTLYHVSDEEKIRVCMNDTYHIPVFIEQDGEVVERTTRIEPSASSLDAAGLLNKYLKEKYRYIDADDDISPDTD